MNKLRVEIDEKKYSHFGPRLTLKSVALIANGYLSKRYITQEEADQGDALLTYLYDEMGIKFVPNTRRRRSMSS